MGQLFYHALMIGGCLIGGLLLTVLILVGLAVWLRSERPAERSRMDD